MQSEYCTAQNNLKLKSTASNENLAEGSTYSFANYDWIVAELKEDYAVLQSCGVTFGRWPGDLLQLGSLKAIGGLDIHTYNTELSELYKQIKDIEYKKICYGKGLYLVSNDHVTKDASKLTLRRFLFGREGKGNYWKALKTAAENHRFYGGDASDDIAWIGSINEFNGAPYYICSDGKIGSNVNIAYSSSIIVAPAFNVDLSRIRVCGNEIVIM